MKELAWLAGATILALSVIAVANGPGHDTMTLVSPPEAVVEEFTRKVGGGRYDVALDHLDGDREAWRARIERDATALRSRSGGIEQVEGEEGQIRGDSATASAAIDTRNLGKVRWWFELVRSNGVWKISEYYAPGI